MTGQKTLDPLSLWKEYYETAGSYWEKTLEEQMKREEFSAFIGKVLDFNLGLRKMMDSTAKQYLEQMNLPSVEDLANVSSLIVNLDAKVDSLEEQMEDISELPKHVEKELTALKTEVKNIQSTLDKILRLVKNQI